MVTIVPRCRLDDARALETAIAAVHPAWRVTTFTTDDPAELGIDERELARMAGSYDEDELCAALKPWALRSALDGGAPVAVYLDSRLRVDGPLDELVAAADARAVAMVPRPQLEGDPLGALEEGVFDAQVLAVSTGGRGFLDWLASRTARHCFRRPEEGLWLDQRWLGVGLAFFDAAIVSGLPVQAEHRRALPSAMRTEIGEPQPAAVDPGPPPIETLVPGVNLVRRIGREEPLDELAGSIGRSLGELGLPVATIGFDAETGGFEGVHPRLAPHDTTLVCLNPLDLLGFAFHVDAEFFERRRSIGVWLAERTPAPDPGAALAFLDEVWVPSAAAARGLAGRTSLPVAALPPPIAADVVVAPALPDDRVVLTICDLGDVFATGALERANPLGLVGAFERAFAPGEGPTLVVWLVDGGRDRYARERVRLASDRPDVVVLDGPLAPAERRALVAACDCYASLHRAADFDVAVAEALAAGRPVIATATDGALLVPAGREPVPAELGTYWTEPTWSEPDLEEAARLLRWCWEEPDEARAVGERGRATVDAAGSAARLTDFLRRELAPARLARGPLARLLGWKS